MQLTRLNVPQGECVVRRARLVIWRLVTALSLGLLLASNVFAQRYSFRNYSHEEGLNDLNIVCLLQDHAGLIWVGTENGLFRFDGRRFVRFGIEDGLPTAYVMSLAESTMGDLWVGTSSGISRRVGERFENAASPGVYTTSGSQTIAPDSAGPGVYVASANGVFALAPGRPESVIPGTQGSSIWSVLSDKGHGVWYSRGDVICHWDGRKPARGVEIDACYGEAAGVPKDRWGGLVADSRGAIWARSASRLVLLRPGAARFEERGQGLPAAARSGSIASDSRGHIIVPTQGGLALWNGSKWSIVTRAEGLVVSATVAALEDREGSLWIGMRGGGLTRQLGSQEWESWTIAQGLASDQISAIARDRRGDLLIGTDQGLYRLSNRKIEPVAPSRFDSTNNRIRGIAIDNDNEDSDDSVWIAAAPGGLARLDEKTGVLTRFPEASDALPGRRILAITVDQQHNVWAVGTAVVRLSRNGAGWSWKRQLIPGSSDGEIFYDVVTDRNGHVWLAGDEGLAEWDGSRWTRLRQPVLPLPAFARYLCTAPDGSMLVSYRDSGRLLQVISSGNRPGVGRWTIRDLSSGAKAENTDSSTFLGYDTAGRLWRGTGTGVKVLTGDHWDHYGQADGLVWNNTAANAFFSDSDGSVWIGTSRGLSHHLSVPKAHLPLPSPIVVGIRSADGTDMRARPLLFDHDGGNFTVQYSALTYREEQDVRFRYRLKGWDDNWIQTQEWEAHFTGVRPGNYTFEVSSGLWGEGWQSVVASAPIRVDGPFWAGRNLWLGLVALVGALLIAAWRTRERIHRRRQTELAVAVDERTEEIARQRIRDQQRNQILEMLVSNQPLGIILNRVLQILVRETPGAMCLILLRSGDTCRVASAAGLPEDWVASFRIPRALPFESWHKESCWSHPGDHPAWGLFHSHLSGPGPAHLHSWPLLIGDVPVGALVQCWPPGASVDHGAPGPTAAAGAGTPQMVLQLTSLAMEHNRLYEDLQFRVRHDALTGLGNRVLFEERLDRALKESRTLGQKLGLVYIDLDFFKEVNDSFSHRVGDLYLCAIADRMRAALRPVDVLARIGGDEFTVLIPNVLDTDDAARLAERVLSAIQQPLSISGHEFHPAASAGVAVYPDDGFDADQLQRFADAAMYHAKNSGRNRVQLFTPSREVPRRAGIDQDLRTALREERFVLHYQPKIGRRNQFMGFEALLRLNHPDYGLVPPLEFIPAAERHGLIIPIGAWVVEEVCRQMAEWRDNGYGDIPVAINVSAIQMSQPDFAKSVIACLSRHNIAPRCFELELTESILVTGSEIALSQMRQLRSTGIRLSIDDFGTGYSSLSYLYRLEVDTVKLDKSFVKSIEDDQMGRWLVKATIGIAQGLGLDVIAEGVETDLQRSALLLAGCHVMQGYLFSHPAPPSELEHWLRRPVDVRKMIAS